MCLLLFVFGLVVFVAVCCCLVGVCCCMSLFVAVRYLQPAQAAVLQVGSRSFGTLRVDAVVPISLVFCVRDRQSAVTPATPISFVPVRNSSGAQTGCETLVDSSSCSDS